MIVIEDRILFDIEKRTNEIYGEHEIGGLFLGYRSEFGIHITQHTTPGWGDVSKPFRFHRRSPKHNLVATKAWAASGFKCDWVGEWHTHPERHPTPSSIDTAEWRRQTRNRNKPMLYLIQGLAGRYVAKTSNAALHSIVHLKQSNHCRSGQTIFSE